MDFKLHIEIAWKLTMKHIIPLVLMTFVWMVISFITVGILCPVTFAGYVQSILRMIRDDREPNVKDLFSHMNLFFPLLGFSILVAVAAMIGFMLFFLPGILIVLAVSFFCLYMIPLMTDRGLSLTDAVRLSSDMALKEDVMSHAVVMLIYVGLTTIGGSVFIASLFTQPFATVFLMSVFEKRMVPIPPAVRP